MTIQLIEILKTLSVFLYLFENVTEISIINSEICPGGLFYVYSYTEKIIQTNNISGFTRCENFRYY